MPVSLASLCAEAARFNVAACEPHPRDHSPSSPFEVVASDIRPDQRYGWIERGKADGVNGSLIPGDMILHLATGVVARVVERISDRKCRVEGWVPPQGDAEMHIWDERPGLGTWVCWGVSYGTEEELPLRLRRPEIVLPGPDFDTTLKDVHPGLRDKPTLAQRQGVPDLSKLPRHVRRRIMRQWRKIVGKVSEMKSWEDPDQAEAEIDKYAVFRKKFESGAEYTKARLPIDDKDRK
jgi:hypothetical protein